METRTATQEVFLNATPQEVFEAFLDEKQHAAFTGLPATIERKPGGKFTACGEHLSGTTLEIAPVHKIVQNWRARDTIPSSLWNSRQSAADKERSSPWCRPVCRRNTTKT